MREGFCVDRTVECGACGYLSAVGSLVAVPAVAVLVKSLPAMHAPFTNVTVCYRHFAASATPLTESFVSVAIAGAGVCLFFATS